MSVEFIDALGGMNAVGYRAGKYVGHRIPGSQIRATLARGDFTGNVPFKVCSNGYSSYFYDENVRANRLKLNDLPALTDGRTCFFFFCRSVGQFDCASRNVVARRRRRDFWKPIGTPHQGETADKSIDRLGSGGGGKFPLPGKRFCTGFCDCAGSFVLARYAGRCPLSPRWPEPPAFGSSKARATASPHGLPGKLHLTNPLTRS